jgi:acetyltransferase-like isoleucine patch superfamily enzyme
LTEEFSTEPYLIEVGNRVAVAGGTVFLTHDGSIRLIRNSRPNAQHLGRVVVGDDTYIGQNCVLLPGTHIGARCILGAGSVVRGQIPDNSLVAGNPARIIGRASLMLERMVNSPDTLDTLHLPEEERRALLEKHFGLFPQDTPPDPK